jgi:hypothetical protein
MLKALFRNPALIGRPKSQLLTAIERLAVGSKHAAIKIPSKDALTGRIRDHLEKDRENN